MRRRFSLAPDALDRLQTYHYPGNVRELRNIVYVSATHSSGDVIQASVIDQAIGQMAHNQTPQEPSVGMSAGQSDLAQSSSIKQRETRGNGNRSKSLDDIEAQHIQKLLGRYAGNRRQVSEDLGISERTLYRKLKKYTLT
jgi:DNA-binding NtrC family response regulator